MKTIPVILGIARTGNTQISSGKPAALDPALKQKIFERYDHTCRCCGFRSQKYQDVLQLPGTSADGKQGNMVTACI